ncbi:putative phenylalanyl-tRna synthetase alpha chain A [Cardiosporidium cionae]|uniref:phenylalanine--tRNA ligase n=1 Tax=Cardiosporidium cionae TaxID=476202 RepID=A0ABQ7JG11_9APIC|nr:putative phenylalanyl-tRna synthetase alpha chain A [Cardiosporidium cionae]|eukprot:KAF8822968.1 putative phenylalanyl-tRna synthetase alpha chain A [Cardiosporidium cionae]
MIQLLLLTAAVLSFDNAVYVASIPCIFAFEEMAENMMESFLAILHPLFDALKDEVLPLNSLHIAKDYYQDDHDKVVGLLKSLEAKGILISDMKETSSWLLTEEGKTYAQEGSPEYRIWKFIADSNLSGRHILMADVKNRFEGLADIGIKIALKNRWICFKGESKHLESVSNDIEDTCQMHLVSILRNSTKQICKNEMIMESKFVSSDAVLQDLKKRKLLYFKKQKYYLILKGPYFSLRLRKQVTDLTSEMLISESWRDADFKDYNFFAAGKRPNKGSIHPLMKIMNKFKKILVSMGFEEMQTDRWVESSFWNFDSLFMPQQHPARDIQDTFFLKEPKFANMEMYPHESYEETSKNILRTHTTAVSARMLYTLAQEYQKTGYFPPKRLFSIDRVFRNETLDATHLAEFHQDTCNYDKVAVHNIAFMQVEGLIAEKGMSIADLMGVLSTFYKRIGITDLKFKPAYNPYTEPSMEIFGFHPLLKKWIEVGNSGVFRPELLLPMGIPSAVQVIAWGLSLERPTMIRYNVKNIRELFGPKAVLHLSSIT